MIDFDDYSERYDETLQKAIHYAGQPPDFFMAVKMHHMMSTIRHHFGSSEGLQLLDVGSGIGRAAAFLSELRCEIHGIDTSEKMIEISQKNNPQGSYQLYDGTTFPFPEQSFDVAFAICVFHHVDRFRRLSLAAEMLRVLRPGGLFLIYEHNPWNPLTRLTVFRCPFDKDALLLRRRESEDLVRRAGCERIRSEYLLLLPFPSHRVRAFEHLLRRLPLGAQYCTIGQRKRSAMVTE